MSTILAIDDKHDNLIGISALLRHFIPGCTVITADSGREGLEKAKNDQPDTILLDLNMPVMDGFEVCKRLKQHPDTRHIPVVILTAVRTDSPSRVKGLELGADAFLSKPIDEVELAAQVKAMLRIKKAEDALRRERDALEDMVRQRIEQLWESEARFKAIFDYTHSGVAVYKAIDGGRDFTFIDFNKAGERIENINKEKLLGRKITEMFPGVKEFGLFEVLQRVWTTGTGEYHPMALYQDDRISGWRDNYVYKLPSGEIVAIYSDETERKLAEISLRNNEERYRELYEESRKTAEIYRSLIHSSADAIVICDLEENVQYVSPVFSQIFGWKIEEIEGKRIPFLPSSEKEATEKIIKKVVDQGIPIRSFRTKRYTRNRIVLNVSISASRYNDHEGDPTGLLFIIRDVTETMRLETQLQQAQKMEAIGTLAGGIAHDFNNILGAIIGYTELTLFDISETDMAHQNLKEALKAANRAKNLVKQILTFSRQSKNQFNPLILNPIIKEVLTFLRSTLPTTIEIRHELREETAAVLADPTQIHQILMNLCTNAAYAMRENGGVLEVRLTDIFIEPTASWTDMESGKYMRLTVSDTGHGMDKETLNRVFEPYFTTKPQDEGTGMGLAVVHGIVKSHGGTIKVYSEPERGTNFVIYFPIISETAGREIRIETAIPTGSERILYVDDEEAIVDIGRQMLERLGYIVDTLTDSQEALAFIRNRPQYYDLIITDQTMPKMTGAELAREIIRLKPDLPIILCTGFSESITEERARNIGIRAFLMKPLLQKDLAITIRSVLDEANNKTW